MPRIEARHITKVFGDAPERALDLVKQGKSKDEILRETGQVVGVLDVSFTVEPGEIFVVMGLSGSGKSTLIRCLNRLHEPTSGELLIDGEDILTASDARLRELRRKTFSMVFQHFGLFPHRTVLENVEYGLKMQDVPRDERRRRAHESLDLVGLTGWGDRKPGDLSGGMQQRVGLARALATDADILLMDEAFSALDPLIRRDLQDQLLQIQRDLGKTIVFITHDLNEALKLGDHTAIMRDGRVVQIGTAEEIVAEPKNNYVLEFTRDVDRGRVLSVSSVMRPPDTLLEGRDTVKTAVARMAATDNDFMMLIDRERKPIGMVLEEDIVKAARQGEDALKPLVTTDYGVVSPDDILMDIYETATAGHCLVAVDDRGRLVGVAQQVDLLASLAPPSDEMPATAGASAADRSPLEVGD
ncbi:MAG: glycine betaine/L-proline ABC transporter ATP-binding protein [Dehalococcoidia bacterium]|nr:glycine betaine/L-proline ABC transporter ATP-binding protein [Dehalococcoidia bacterium]MCA9857045.1 glycine betaine/L-proline ABC transporter ATP-binding protein [Dehalococcoidia bacterium]MCB9483615.1 glycine betaine/L-proline ABC transporter ATP-binding protein [Dehalococcoidia bacterium]